MEVYSQGSRQGKKTKRSRNKSTYSGAAKVMLLVHILHTRSQMCSFYGNEPSQADIRRRFIFFPFSSSLPIFLFNYMYLSPFSKRYDRLLCFSWLYSSWLLLIITKLCGLLLRLSLLLFLVLVLFWRSIIELNVCIFRCLLRMALR